MIYTKQLKFDVEFGVDEKVEVAGPRITNLHGAKGYVNEIIIDRNGISYSVIIMEKVQYRVSDGNCVKTSFRPIEVRLSSYMLKSIR